MLMYTIRIFLVICYACFGLSAQSQNQQKADSILLLLKGQDLSNEKEMKAYYLLSGYSSSPEDELKYGKKLLELAKESKSTEYQIKANQRIGIAHRMMGNLGDALTHLYESAKKASAESQFTSLLADSFIEISSCYTQNGDKENAMLYGRKAIEILRRTDRKQELALNLLNLGYDYYLSAQYDSALSFYNESEPIFQEVGMTIGIAYVIGNRSLVYWKSGNLEKAKLDLTTAIAILTPLEDLYGMADYYNQLGKINYEQSEWKQAIVNTELGLQMALQEGMKEQVRDASQLLFVLHKKSGALDQAIDYQSQYYTYRDSIQNPKTTELLANLKADFEVVQKQAEIDHLLEQKRIDQIIKMTGGITLLLVIFIALVTRRKARKKLSFDSNKHSS